jgi:hypothetical protein
MNTVQFFAALANWLLADPVHLTFAAGVVAMITPTPNPSTWAGKAYKILDIFALNFLKAKDTGLTALDPQVAAQVAALLGEFQKAAKAGAAAPATTTGEAK